MTYDRIRNVREPRCTSKRERGLAGFRYNRAKDKTFIVFFDASGRVRDKYAYTIRTIDGVRRLTTRTPAGAKLELWEI